MVSEKSRGANVQLLALISNSVGDGQLTAHGVDGIGAKSRNECGWGRLGGVVVKAQRNTVGAVARDKPTASPYVSDTLQSNCENR
jgi:hypothetical protein